MTYHPVAPPSTPKLLAANRPGLQGGRNPTFSALRRRTTVGCLVKAVFLLHCRQAHMKNFRVSCQKLGMLFWVSRAFSCCSSISPTCQGIERASHLSILFLGRFIIIATSNRTSFCSMRLLVQSERVGHIFKLACERRSATLVALRCRHSPWARLLDDCSRRVIVFRTIVLPL